MTIEQVELTIFLQDIKHSEPSITLSVDKEIIAQDVIKNLCTKARLHNASSYELAEIFVSSGQLCKERRISMTESPVKLQSLWPKGGALAPDATYRFYLVRKGNIGGFLRSLSWNSCPHSADVPSDSYLIKFLEQKTAGADYADLCSLPDLNERTLLDNLKMRFHKQSIYTYVGSILIAINPFQFFPVYNPKYVSMYQDVSRISELPPHIFAISNAAFNKMLDHQVDQCIVISGESGSGKTQNTNFLLNFLTQTTNGQQSIHRSFGIEKTLLGAGSVLEAFGNAKTVYNDNSSRFGKFIMIDYRKNGSVHGASLEKYLLEKSRIVSQGTNERNYHVFYYLLRGASSDLVQDLHLLRAEDYHYLNQTGCYTLTDVDDVNEFERLKSAMEMVGFKPDLQKRIFAVLSAVLLLGNIEFVKRHSSHHEESVQVKNNELVSKISRLLDVKVESFLDALTSKRTIAGGETMVVRYKHHDAISARNAMAKCLYGAIFDWIVWQINHSLFQKQDHRGQKSNSIGILDIFGFENFNRNSFEQFCINYANEHLQYYFNQHIFKLEQEDYKKEKIEWQDISFIDNRGCLDLYAKRPNGLFFLLDEEGNFPGATNETLLEKFHQNHKGTEFYMTPLRKESTFTICHYAGSVKYSIQDFREKNSDLIHADLVSVLKNSGTAFVRELVGCDPVAMLRWSYVRLCMKSVYAFVQAGKTFHSRGGNKIGNIRRKTSTSRKNMKELSYSESTSNFSNITSDASESDAHDNAEDGDTYIHSTGKKASRRRHKMYKDYQQFKTYQEIKNRETSKAKTPSVSLQFQKSLQSLLETLDRSHPYFIRCIKSNNEKSPCTFDDQLVLKQLQYTGMLATVRLRQSGYNYRVPFKNFISHYSALLPGGSRSSVEEVKTFLTSMDNNENSHSFQIGKTMVFLRETVKMLLDDALHHSLLRQVLKIQSWVRTRIHRGRFLNMKRAAITIQRYFRGYHVRKVFGPVLAKHKEDLRRRELEEKMRIDEEKRRIAEEERRIAEEERRIAEEERRIAEEGRRFAEEAIKFAKRKKAALYIWRWYCNRRAVIKSRELLRQLKIEAAEKKASLNNQTTEPSQSIPSTDIDQLATALDKQMELSSKDKVESWLNERQDFSLKSSDSSLTASSPIDTKEQNSIAVSNNDSPKESPKQGGIKRRSSLERRSAMRSKSNKEDNQVIPIVQKNYIPSPESSLEYMETEEQVLSPDVPQKLELNNRKPEVASQPEHGRPSVNNINQDNLTNGVSPVILSDQTFQAATVTDKRLSQSSMESNSSKAKQSPMLKLDSLFYMPDKPTDNRLNLTKASTEVSSHDNGKNIESKMDNGKTYDNIIANKADNENVINNVVPMKSPLRKSSSIDPEPLLRYKSQENEFDVSKDTLSPQSNVTRKSSRTSADDDEMLPSFNRNNILRQHVHHVRKSQSADCLAPPSLSSKDLTMSVKDRKITAPELGAKNSSQESLGLKTSKEVLARQKNALVHMVPDASRSVNSLPDSDDSDLDSSYTKVNIMKSSPFMGDKRKADVLLATFQPPNKKIPPDPKTQNNLGGSQWSVSSTSEWNYPETLAIDEHEELSELIKFLNEKYANFVRLKDKEKQSIFDQVFSGSMKDMCNKLYTKSAVADKNPKAWQSIKFRELMSWFQDDIKGNIQKNRITKEQLDEFPSLVAINAFRGYLDEYQKKRSTLKRKQVKPKPKEQRNRKPNKETIKVKGHQLIPYLFNIPTFCEICNKMLFWNIKDKAFNCQNCKLSCHKKCSAQINQHCPNSPNEEVSPNAVYGVQLSALSADDGIPIILERLLAEIENRGLYTDGIYRKSGAAARVKTLKKALDTDWEKVDLSEYAVHVLSMALKNFFRELPEPLFTFELYDEFIRCPDIANKEEAMNALKATLNKLPPVNINVVSRLMLHLASIAKNEDANRMSSNALSIVFAPGLLRTKKPLSAQESFAQVDKQCRCLEMMIRDKLKHLDDTLYEIRESERELQVLEHRLTTVRQSIRKFNSQRGLRTSSVLTELEESDMTSISETASISSLTSIDIGQAQEEEKNLSLKLKSLSEHNDKLKRQITNPPLQGSDGDDVGSTDDIESSPDDLEE